MTTTKKNRRDTIQRKADIQNYLRNVAPKLREKDEVGPQNVFDRAIAKLFAKET